MGLVYEVVSEMKLEDSFHEERRTSVIGIFRLEAGKLISGDLVVGECCLFGCLCFFLGFSSQQSVADTAPFQERESVNLDCTVS